MSEGRFASLTAGLLVRKGEARPSSIMPLMPYSHARAPERIEVMPVQDWTPSAPSPMRREPPKPLAVVPASTPKRADAFMPLASSASPEVKAKPSKPRNAAPPGEPPPPAKTDKPRRLMVTLSPGEYETLGIIGVKKNATRHQLLRSALNEYLALLVEEFSGDCQCIYTGGGCGSSCANN
jgi:hypothetical protein